MGNNTMLAGPHRGEISSGLLFLFWGGRGKVRQIAFRGDLLFSYYGLFWVAVRRDSVAAARTARVERGQQHREKGGKADAK